jgi:hypothetical protein
MNIQNSQFLNVEMQKNIRLVQIAFKVITRVLGHRPKSRGSTCQVQPLAPPCKIKRSIMVKGRERRFIV